MIEIPPLTVICIKLGVEVEREVDFVERGTPIVGSPRIWPKLFPGEQCSHTIDGQIHIFDVNHSPFADDDNG